MQTTQFVELTSTRANPHVDPVLHIWGWEVPVDLFAAALAAGLLILSAWFTLRRDARVPAAAATRSLAPILVVPVLCVGLTALFLDLEYKAHLFHFYTTLEPKAPMSWGSWILAAVSVFGGLAGLAALRARGGALAERVFAFGFVARLADLAQRKERALARLNLTLGVALAVYTGVLLATYAARPLWSSSVLPLLFLVSGLASAAALVALLRPLADERRLLGRAVLVLLGVQAVLLGLFLVGLLTGGEPGRDAVALILGGPYTAAFWALVVVVGLALPALIEALSLHGRVQSHLVAPALVLVGALALRFVLVQAGQIHVFPG